MLKKIIAAAAVAVIAAILLPGCSLTADGVKLANKKEITAYVQSAVGDAEFIRSVKGKNRIDYYFREPVTGIEFTASTYASSNGLDGSAFYYTENRNNDFYEKYAGLIMDGIEPELDMIREKYGKNVLIEKDVFYSHGGDGLLRISFIKYETNFTEDDVIKIAKEVGAVIEGKEPLHKYGSINLYTGNSDPLGKYVIASKEFIPEEDLYGEK